MMAFRLSTRQPPVDRIPVPYSFRQADAVFHGFLEFRSDFRARWTQARRAGK